MPNTSSPLIRVRELERLLRSGLTRLATSDEADLHMVAEEVQSLLQEMAMRLPATTGRLGALAAGRGRALGRFSG